jgi:hypothetical protein
MVDTEGIGLAGAFTGVFLRTMLAYIKARNEAEQLDKENKLEFDRKFLVTAVMAGGSAAATAILVFPTLMGQLPANGTGLATFVMAAGIGWALNDGINMIVSVGQNTIRASKDVIAGLKQYIATQGLESIRQSVKK